MNEGIDVISSPIALIRKGALVLIKRIRIREIHARYGIRVEIIVKMHGVDIVIPNDLHDAVNDELLRLRNPWIEIQLAAVFLDPVGMLSGRVIRHQLVDVSLQADSIRIEPGVELHVSLMHFLEQECQRIVTRILALFTCQPLGPRPVLGRVKASAVGLICMMTAFIPASSS